MCVQVRQNKEKKNKKKTSAAAQGERERKGKKKNKGLPNHIRQRLEARLWSNLDAILQCCS